MVDRATVKENSKGQIFNGNDGAVGFSASNHELADVVVAQA